MKPLPSAERQLEEKEAELKAKGAAAAAADAPVIPIIEFLKQTMARNAAPKASKADGTAMPDTTHSLCQTLTHSLSFFFSSAASLNWTLCFDVLCQWASSPRRY